MKNLKLNKKLLAMLLAGSIALTPISSLAGSYVSGIDLNDDIEEYQYDPEKDYGYEDWFKPYKTSCYTDLLYTDLMEKLPPFMIDLFRTTKWNIKLVNKGWLSYNWGVNGRGACYYEKRTIAVEGFYRGKDLVKLYQERHCDQEYLDNTDLVTLNYLAIRSAIFHECGHMLDYNYKYTNKKEWNRIYAAEKGNANYMSSRYWEGMTSGTYNLKYNYEFWATCFEAYILCREDLQEYCPQAYEYIHNIVYTREKEFEETHPEYDYYHEREGLIK